MHTITLDDKTYKGLMERAATDGLSLESWLKTQSIILESIPQLPVDRRPFTELTIGERLERLQQFKKVGGDYGASVDYSRDQIYP